MKQQRWYECERQPAAKHLRRSRCGSSSSSGVYSITEKVMSFQTPAALVHHTNHAALFKVLKWKNLRCCFLPVNLIPSLENVTRPLIVFMLPTWPRGSNLKPQTSPRPPPRSNQLSAGVIHRGRGLPCPDCLHARRPGKPGVPLSLSLALVYRSTASLGEDGRQPVTG